MIIILGSKLPKPARVIPRNGFEYQKDRRVQKLIRNYVVHNGKRPNSITRLETERKILLTKRLNERLKSPIICKSSFLLPNEVQIIANGEDTLQLDDFIITDHRQSKCSILNS